MLSKEKLRKMGTIVDDTSTNNLWLSCRSCGVTWTPNQKPKYLPGNGPFYRGYWVCPNGCNKGATQWTKEEQYQD